MENGDKKNINAYEFFDDAKVSEIFAKTDYLLRSGVHIQRNYPLPSELFRFIERNYESLKVYYQDIFKVILCRQGVEFKRYYFIDFDEDNRGNIPVSSRSYLKTEYIIIGLLFFKLYRIDGNIELSSVSDFITTLFSEYEEEKGAFRKLIVDLVTTKSTDFNDERIEEIIRKAFNSFNDLGWIAWANKQNRDKFNCMPSFERLRLMYQSQILGIDDLIKEINGGK